MSQTFQYGDAIDNIAYDFVELMDIFSFSAAYWRVSGGRGWFGWAEKAVGFQPNFDDIAGKISHGG